MNARACLPCLVMVVGLLGPNSLLAQQVTSVDFDRDVAPILIRHCLDCHGGLKPKGGLDLTSKKTALVGGDSGAAIVAGKPNASELWKRVQAGEMPPKKPLGEAEKKMLQAWLAQGAAWGTDPIDPFRVTTTHRAGYDWWSLKPVAVGKPPAVKANQWPINAIDHFVLARLEAEGLKPSPPADRVALIRRLSFDLLGLPPTPKEIDDFVKDADPRAYEKLVDRLLAAPRYGERWARHWLDVVRFGESHGFEHDELRRNAWPYRDWVIKALNDDMPYDEFARLQIAGDVLRPEDPSGVAATGFLVAGGYDSVGQAQQSAAMKAVVRQDELEDIVGTLGQTFLGLTVHCARCHDHKFDPIRLTEYYRLAAAVAGVHHGERDLTPPKVLAAFKKELADRMRQLKEIEDELDKLARPIRTKLLAEHLKQGKQLKGPEPKGRWDFTRSLKDEVGGLDVTLHGGASRSLQGLELSGKGSYASTGPLVRNVGARTLAVVVRLRDVQQRGGAVVSLQSLDGRVFDAIVFGEREAGHWLAGSNFFERTQAFQGPKETAVEQPIHMAIVWRDDGMILAYRNGQPYGKPYQAKGPLAFAAGQAQFLFGLRHSPPGGSKHLAGTIVRAEFHDRALSPAEIAAAAASDLNQVPEEAIVAGLSEGDRARWAQLSSEKKRLESLPKEPAGTKVYAVLPRTPALTHVLFRGEPGNKGSVVTPGGLVALGAARADFGLSPDASDAERRRKLADWITHPENPLFAQVMVNRVWQHHFGIGLVETPSDFGFSGGRPSHPDLLAWLADEFRRSGYKLKALHRLIVTSAAYRQQSRFQTDAAKLDAANRLLWRKSPMRLEAEVVRDAMLFVAGELNLEMGGPGYQDFKLFVRGATHYYTPVDVDSPLHQRRSIYRTWVRSGRNPLLDTLDCPDPSTVTPRRAVTTTPLQALSLLNNSFVLRMAERLAKRLEREAGPQVDDQVRLAYRLAFGRRPRPEELAEARGVVQRFGLRILCRAIFNSNEFLYVD